MSNSTPRPAKPKKQRQKALPRAENTPLWKTIVGWTVTGIGLVAAGLTFLPRVTASVSDPVDRYDPFSSSVLITNTGYLSLDSVTANISVGKIVFMGPKGPVTLLGDEANSEWRWKDWTPHDLGVDDRFTVALNDPLRGQSATMISAQIAVVVTYQLPYIHVHRKKLFPLTLKQQSNGSFYWYADTLPAK